VADLQSLAVPVVTVEQALVVVQALEILVQPDHLVRLLEPLSITAVEAVEVRSQTPSHQLEVKLVELAEAAQVQPQKDLVPMGFRHISARSSAHQMPQAIKMHSQLDSVDQQREILITQLILISHALKQIISRDMQPDTLYLRIRVQLLFVFIPMIQVTSI
jgi:hypothetical protein